MDKIVVRMTYLKSAHYFFFAMAVFSLTAAIAFWEVFLAESTIFLFFCVIYANISFWLAYFFYKDYSEQVENLFVLRRYTWPYVLLSVLVVAMTEGMIVVTPSISGVIYSTLFINYYYLFIVGMGALSYAFKPVRRLFEFKSALAIGKGRDIVLKFSRLDLVREYKTGTDPYIDEMFENIANSKDYPTPHVQRLEIELCSKRLRETETKLELARSQGRNKRHLEMLEREKEEYEHLLEKVRSYRD